MKRTSHVSKKANLFGTGKDGFTDGSPGVEAPTVLESTVANSWQEEIARAVEQVGGVALDGNDYGQLAHALLVRFANQDYSREVNACSTIAEIRATIGSAHWAWFAGSGKGHIVACGANAAVAQSGDLGRQWTTIGSDAGFTGNYEQCAAGFFGGQVYKCAVGEDNIQAATMLGGLTQRVLLTGGATARGVAYGNGRFVVKATGGVYISTNGLTFNFSSDPSTPVNGKLWFGGGVFAGLSSGASVVASADGGVTWHDYATAAGRVPVRLDHSNGVWWALTVDGTGTTAFLERSVDGCQTWATAAGPATITTAGALWLVALPGGAYAGIMRSSSTIGVGGLAASNTGIAVPGFTQATYADMILGKTQPLDDSGQYVIFGRNLSDAGSILRQVVSSV